MFLDCYLLVEGKDKVQIYTSVYKILLMKYQIVTSQCHGNCYKCILLLNINLQQCK